MENKNSKLLIVMVVILSILVLGLGGYVVYDKVLSKNEEKVIVENIENDDLIYKEETTVSLNNNSHKLTYEYYYEEDDYEKDGEQFYYIVRLKVLLDNKEIDYDDGFIYFNSPIDHKTAKEIESYLKNDSQIEKPIHKIIESSNKDYLFLDLQENHDNLSRSLRSVIDENKSIVYDFEYGISVISLNDTTEDYEKFKVKDYYIEHGKLYHLSFEYDTISEVGLPSASIRTVSFDNDINISKRHLNEDEYEGSGIK